MKETFFFFFKGPDEDVRDRDAEATQQQQDWSLVCECFESPQQLLKSGSGLSKPMQVRLVIS